MVNTEESVSNTPTNKVCRENIESVSDTPTKKELYFEADLKIGCNLGIVRRIQFWLGAGSARLELFRGTCFGPWLDVRSAYSDSCLVHLMLQTECISAAHQDALIFRVGGQELRFGPQEFCLITGMRFGPYHLGQGRADMTFRERVFGGKAIIKVWDLEDACFSSLFKLSDVDAVRVCLLVLLVVGFMGKGNQSVVDPALLELVEDLDSWNAFPWGSYLWKAMRSQLHNALIKRSSRLSSLEKSSIPKKRILTYWLRGFVWAFQIWIFEVFPYARRFATKHNGIPRAICWDKKDCITWKLALPFVTDATVPGSEPLPVLTPTLAESATDWWRASRQYFDSFADGSSPPLKKAHIISQPQQPVKVQDQLIDDIANTATVCLEDIAGTITLLCPDKITSHQTMECIENTKKQIQEVEIEKISSQSNIICVQGYKVKQSVAPILGSIFKKHGDIAAECVFTSASMRSSFLETICEVVCQVQINNNKEKMEEIEQQLLVIEAANINVSWLRAHLKAVHKRKDEGKKCTLLMEMKANTILAENSAQMDLREIRVELVAAQERFEKAERCVRVLHLVKKNLNESILDSQAKIDSWAEQPVL